MTSHNFYKDYHLVNDEVAIYTRADSRAENPVWQARIKVSAENRYVTRSTRKTNKAEAEAVAIDLWHEAKVLKKHGDTAKLWVRPFDQVAKEFLKAKEHELENGLAKASAVKLARFGIPQWINHLGNKPLSQITKEMVDGYQRVILLRSVMC